MHLCSISTKQKTVMNKIPPALLECWMREYYFNTNIDIGSSGVESFCLADIRQLTGLTQKELDSVVFNDSSSFGGFELRREIASRWGNGNPEQVMVTHGSSEAIYLAMSTLLNPNDEVVVLDPCYQQLYSIAESIGCKLKIWRLRPEHNFVPDVQEAKSLITPNTRMVVVNFPHNPTGASLTLKEQQELINAVAEVGAYLVWDAAFADLVYKGSPLPPPNLQYEGSISLGTLSKAYGLPGLRFGWCIAASDILERFVYRRDYITLHLSPLVELIAHRVIQNINKFLNIRLHQAHTNLRILSEWIEQHKEFVDWVYPQGGVCGFLHMHTISNAEAFCDYLGKTYGVLLVPGNCFNHEKYVRLGFGTSTSDLSEGLSRLSKALVEYEVKVS